MKDYAHDKQYTYQACGFTQAEVDKLVDLEEKITKKFRASSEESISHLIKELEDAASSKPEFLRFLILELVATMPMRHMFVAAAMSALKGSSKK